MHPTVQVELIKQIAEVVKTLIWPLAGLVVIFAFRRGFAAFFNRLEELTFKTPAGEFSARTTAAAGALVAAETARKGDQDADPEARAIDVKDVTERVEAAARSVPRLKRKTILWVDDNPGGNRYESQAFEALGITVETAISTNDAVNRLQARPYDLAITDLTRPGEKDAGLTFIGRARAIAPTLPIVVYSSSRGAVQYPRAYELGAAGATWRPNELFDRVISLLGA